jgi:glycosyltransferase involved in cell wall biosynthesis
MSKPRILIIENSIDFTGGLNSIMSSCIELKDSFDFLFVLPTGSRSITYVEALDIPVHVLPMKELRKSWTALLLYFPLLILNSIRFAFLVKRLKIDIILSNDFYNLIPSMYKVFGGKAPYACYVRFRPSKFPSTLVKFWCWFHYRYAAFVIAVSNVVRQELPALSTLTVIGNEVPSEDVSYSPSQSRIILYPANYIRGKGQELALRSFTLIKQKYPDWKLKFVGSDMGLEKNRAFRRELEHEAGQLGISHVVEWGNFEKNMARQYISAALVLNFSESESFSLTCLESMYYGRPTIATRCGGPEEIIDHGLTGLLVNPADVDGMAAAIDHLISDPPRREELGRLAFVAIRQKYSYENTVGRLKQLYNSLLSQQSFNAR